MSQSQHRKTHRKHPSHINPGKRFPEPFIGVDPGAAERKAYMAKYFVWMRKLKNPQREISEYRLDAAQSVSEALFKNGRKGVATNLFWYWVDRAVWTTFFADYEDDGPQPLWPWHRPVADSSGRYSQTYENLFNKMQEAKQLEESSAAASQDSRKRPAEHAEDRSVKRVALERDADAAVEREESVAAPLTVTVTHEVGQDGWPLLRYQARRE